MSFGARDLDRVLGALPPARDEPAGPSSLRDPLDCLIATLLSQATSDVNSQRAFRNLKERYPAWDEALAVPAEEIAAAIEQGGLSKVKSERIHEILRAILRDRGRLSLDFLSGLDLDEAKRRLLAFRGVGPKTAACVLLFALGKPAFPVDTHVLRVMKRLGLASPSASPEQVQRAVEAALQGEPDARSKALDLHLGLIRHGRTTCRARNPRCAECALGFTCRAKAQGSSSSGAFRQA